MITSNSRQLAIFLKQARKKLKLTQAELAKISGLKQKTISAFENNPDSIKLNTAFRILSAVNLKINLIESDSSNSWAEEW